MLPPLTRSDFDALIADYAWQPVSSDSPALERLLYHGEQVREMLESYGELRLDPERRAFLDRELSRSTATVSFRIVDEHGVVRARLDEARVTIGVKAHLRAEITRDLQVPEFSGTVIRTGLAHLWTRF